jgi:hypothetical protein
MKKPGQCSWNKSFRAGKIGANSAAHLESFRQPWCIRDRKLLIPVRCTMRKFHLQRPSPEGITGLHNESIECILLSIAKERCFKKENGISNG